MSLAGLRMTELGEVLGGFPGDAASTHGIRFYMFSIKFRRRGDLGPSEHLADDG
tara:strand:+ start:2514 stop:2675 length:162 start_codon:yes stop_codon:yes gene_type:complete